MIWRSKSSRRTTTVDSELQSADLPTNLTLSLDSWYKVSAQVTFGSISVTIDGDKVLDLSQDEKIVASFGFGASFGHRVIFRNLAATTPAVQQVYSHSLTDPSFLADFFFGDNPNDNVVDGSRRDRIAYTGDLDIAGGAALATPGFFIPTAKIQQENLEERLDIDMTGLIGYSFNFLTAVANTYMYTGDIDFARQWAPSVKAMLDWADSQTLDNGLFNVSQVSFCGDWNYYDPYQAGVVTKFNVVYAYALQECHQLQVDAGNNSTVYADRLDKLRIAIDTQLWNGEINTYYVSDAITDGFAQDANAIAILAGVNLDPAHSSKTILESLDTLLIPAGSLAFSDQVIAAGFQSYISPYASSYHLRAALPSIASAM